MSKKYQPLLITHYMSTWITITEAVEITTKAIKQKITPSDIYRHALSGNILLSVYFQSPVNRPGFPGECFICELRLPDHRFRWKHNKLFLLLPEE
ncbi:hypothetical protein, partial [Escherichia coli]|uniref:hypothetical protein n=1 Tax=Escherichia coli TaxID=562 RepID=UPI000A88669D